MLVLPNKRVLSLGFNYEDQNYRGIWALIKNKIIEWENCIDPSFSTSYTLNSATVTLINPLYEDPFTPKDIDQ